MGEVNEPLEDGEIMYHKDRSVLLDGMSIAFAEFLGSLLLVFINCTGCTIGISTGIALTLQLNITAGLAVMTAMQLFSHISGAHVNPAVTICSFIMGKTGLNKILIYITFQIAGSVIGYALVMAVAPKQFLEIDGGHCLTVPSREITLFQAFLVESIATCIMCLGICASWDSRNSKQTDSLPLKIGLIVVVLNMAVGPYTGASMNPVRSFGPAVWNINFENHWIYWCAPFTGAAITGLFYKKIFLNKSSDNELN